MATGASTADLAVILIDARKGVLTQTRRHSYLVSLLGIRHDRARRQQDGSRRLLPGASSTTILQDYRAFAAQIGLDRHHGHPDLGLYGRQHRRALARTRPGTPARR
jgi:bifunctional enzyme CysN/CysC